MKKKDIKLYMQKMGHDSLSTLYGRKKLHLTKEKKTA